MTPPGHRSSLVSIHIRQTTRRSSDGRRHTGRHCIPISAGGAYVNFMMDEGAERVKATYRDNYERLVILKNMYDPTNLFRVNQNITPTV